VPIWYYEVHFPCLTNYLTDRFITVFTRARHRPLSWANWIHSTTPQKISLEPIMIPSSHLYLGLPRGLFPSGFPTKTLYIFLPSPMRATCPTHLILLDLICIIICYKKEFILKNDLRYFTRPYMTQDSPSIVLLFFISMGQVYISLNCDHQRAYSSSPRWCMITENGGIIATGENQRTLAEVCSSGTLPTTNPTRTRMRTRVFVLTQLITHN
jgi:hypothetical protein